MGKNNVGEPCKVRESKIFRLRKESLEVGNVTAPLMGWNPKKRIRLCIAPHKAQKGRF